MTITSRLSRRRSVSESAGNQIELLRNKIRHHDRLYYIEATPEISDLEYDTLMKQLEQLESENPELVTNDSPTQRVGEEPVSHLEQIEHRIPMLSIENTYNLEELEQYGRRTEQLLDGADAEWVVELKIDGVAASVVYEQGRLAYAVTRGNGQVGDNITHNIRTIADVPLKLSGSDFPPVLEVRAEVYMSNSDLVKLNQLQLEASDSLTLVFVVNVGCGYFVTVSVSVREWRLTPIWNFSMRFVILDYRPLHL